MFLKKLYNQWRSMFYVVMLFLAAQFFFMYKAVETVPFFLFHMFSVPSKEVPDTVQRMFIYINGKKFDTNKLTGRERETLLGSFDYFLGLKTKNFLAADTTAIRRRFKGKVPDRLYDLIYSRLTNSSVTDTTYLQWWCRYLSRVSGLKVDSIRIIMSSVSWTPSFHYLNDTTELLKYVRK